MPSGDLWALNSKVTSGDAGKGVSSIKQLQIGAVPDRGGRPQLARQPATSALCKDPHKRNRVMR
jgi:hypothetical protein